MMNATAARILEALLLLRSGCKPMFDKILVVCVGNICRSPTGERLLRSRLPGRQVTSAGLSALVDKPADAVAVPFF